MSYLACWHLLRIAYSTFWLSLSAFVIKVLIRPILKSVLSRVPLILSNVFLYYVITSSAASLKHHQLIKYTNLLKIPHSMLLRVLIHALHTHQLVAGEAILFEIGIRMLSTYERVHGL